MGKFFAQLKQKGPGGIPLYIYAVGSIVLLYFGYRFFKNRGSSGGSSSSADTGAMDTSGDTGGVGGDASSGQPDLGSSSSDGTTDNSLPDSTQDTAPGAADSTGIINGPISLGHKLKQKVKKKGHASAHDHKQGTHGTSKRAVHRRKAGTAQTPHAHAPKNDKRPHSTEKRKTVSNVKLPTTTRSGELVKHGGAAPPPVHAPTATKKPPVAIARETPKVAAKAPVKKKK